MWDRKPCHRRTFLYCARLKLNVSQAEKKIISLKLFEWVRLILHFHEFPHLTSSGQPSNQICVAYYLSQSDKMCVFISIHPVSFLDIGIHSELCSAFQYFTVGNKNSIKIVIFLTSSTKRDQTRQKSFLGISRLSGIRSAIQYFSGQ